MMFRLPYPGLRSFNRDESDLFFGRDGCVDQMVERLASTRFLAVLGTSGTGKSSLVKTGLLDALELGVHPAGSAWRICSFTPAGDPFGSLATSLLEEASTDTTAWQPRPPLENMLRRGPSSVVEWANDGNLAPGTNLLLLVDQFEELFRFDNYSEREDAEAFAKLLICSSEPISAAIHIVITMRSEFLGACALIPGLAEKINQGLYLVPRMTRSECEAAIVGPARVTGFQIESRLVTQVLNDMERFAPWSDDHDLDPVRRISRRADQLPVMQHVLNRMARRAQDESNGRRLTLEHYERLGGVRGALNAHGEELLATVGAERQSVVEKIFRALVAGDSPTSATRRPLKMRQILAETGAERDDVSAALDVFRSNDANFLRPSFAVRLSDKTVIDIAHESLIRQWSKLSDWVAREAQSAESWRLLASRANRHSRREEDLLSGLGLASLERWWRADKPQAGWAARYGGDFEAIASFLDQSLADEEHRRNAQLERERREKERWREALDTTAQNFGTNKDVDTAVKLVFIEDIESRTEETLRDRPLDGDLLSRKAELLTTTAQMLKEVGYLDRSNQRAEAAHAILFPEADVEPQNFTHALRAKGKLLVAQAHWHRRALTKSQTALDEAASNLAEVKEPGWEEAVLSARVGALQASLHEALDRHHEAIVTIERTIGAAKEFALATGSSALSFQQRALDEIVGRLYVAWVQVLAAVSLERETILAEAKDFVTARFGDVDQPGSHYLRSTLTALIEAHRAQVSSDQGDHQQVLSRVDEAVDTLDQLSVKDWQNLDCRRELGRILLRRAHITSGLGNLPQAAADVASARTIAYHTKLEDELPGAALLIDVWSDYMSAQIAEAQGKRDVALIGYRRISTRLKLFAELMEQEDLDRRFGAFEVWGATIQPGTDPKRVDEILDLVKNRLALYSVEPKQEVDKTYAAKQRYYTLARLLDWSPSLVGEETWNEYLDMVIRDTTYLASTTANSTTWLLSKSNVLGTRAAYLRDSAKDLPSATNTWLEALSICVPLLRIPASFAPATRMSIYHLNSAKDLFPQSTSTDRTVALLTEFVDVLAEPPAVAAVSALREELLIALSARIAAISDNLKVDTGTPASMLAALELQQQRLGSLRDPEATAETSPLTARTDGAFNFRELNLGYDGALDSLRTEGRARINWSTPPLFAATWRTLLDDERDSALEQFVSAGALKRRDIKQFVVRVRSAMVDFYDGGQLLDAEVEFETGPRVYSLLLVRGGSASVLDGKSPPIHRINEQGVLLLDTPSRVAGYLRFFCSYVNGEAGSFQLVEYVNDLIWYSTADQSTRETVARMLRPVVVWRDQNGNSEGGSHWSATATVQYSRDLFFAKFEIQPTGLVTMSSDQPVMANLPITPIGVNGRLSEVKRVTVLRQEIATFDDDPVFLRHLVTLPTNRRPKSFEWLVKETLTLAGVDATNARSLNTASYALIEADLLLDQAVGLAEKAHAVQPDNPNILDTLGWGYVKIGRLSEAIELFQKAISLFEKTQPENTNLAETYAHLGQAYRLAGNVTEARATLNTARSRRSSDEVRILVDNELQLLESNTTKSDAQ